MPTSEEYLRDLGGADWQEALGTIYEHLGNKASGYVASHLGVSTRQAQRMAAGAGITAATQRASGSKHADTLQGLAAALQVAGMTTIHAGVVRVHYEGADQGSRDIGTCWNVDMDTVRDALERGDFTEASHEFDQQVLGAYGMPGNELGISNYEDGLWAE